MNDHRAGNVLVIPRSFMRQMPAEWQARMEELEREYVDHPMIPRTFFQTTLSWEWDHERGPVPEYLIGHAGKVFG